MSNKTATIYSTPTCGYCKKAKQLLADNNISYVEYTVGKDCTKEQVQALIVESTGTPMILKTVPQIFIEKQYIGGFDHLVKHLKK